MSADYTFDDDGDGEGYFGMDGAEPSVDFKVEKPVAKFFSLSSEEVLEKYVDPLVRKLGPLGLSKASSIFLLAANRWHDERAMSAYFDDEKKTCRAAHNMSVCPADAVPFTLRAEKTYDCKVCRDTEQETMAGGSLSCMHGVCTECWRGAIDSRLGSVGEDAWFMTCPQHGCGLPAAPVFAERAIVPAATAQKLNERLARSFVAHNAHMLAHCCGATCGRFIYCGPSRTTLPPHEVTNMVRCTGCNSTTCVRCEREAHLPASCEDMTKWDSKEQQDSANAQWILANTKKCPKCHVQTQKNLGCQHMTCASCKFEYCWSCLGSWTSHGDYYNCNRPKAPDAGKTQAQNELELYLHYYQRFRTHQKSKQLDGITVTKARAKVEALVRSGQARLHDAEFWEATAKTLVACRHTLMYSYIYAFYLPRSTPKERNQLDLFEYQQGMLEKAAEELSESVNASTSNSDPDSHSEVVGRTAIAAQMLKGLEEGIATVKKGQ